VEKKKSERGEKEGLGHLRTGRAESFTKRVWPPTRKLFGKKAVNRREKVKKEVEPRRVQGRSSADPGKKEKKQRGTVKSTAFRGTRGAEEDSGEGCDFIKLKRSTWSRSTTARDQQCKKI